MKSSLLGFALALSVLFNVFFIVGAWQAKQVAQPVPDQDVTLGGEEGGDLPAATDGTNDGAEADRAERIRKRETQMADQVAERLSLTPEQRDTFLELRLLMVEEEEFFD